MISSEEHWGQFVLVHLGGGLGRRCDLGQAILGLPYKVRETNRKLPSEFIVSRKTVATKCIIGTGT
jgi:hypothetical protein